MKTNEHFQMTRDNGARRVAMFGWHGYTVFLVARVEMFNTGLDEPGQGIASTTMAVGAAFCSPREKKMSVKKGFEKCRERLETRPIRTAIPCGLTLERSFKRGIRARTPQELSKLGVPDRMIEAIHRLAPWSFQTKSKKRSKKR